MLTNSQMICADLDYKDIDFTYFSKYGNEKVTS